MIIPKDFLKTTQGLTLFCRIRRIVTKTPEETGRAIGPERLPSQPRADFLPEQGWVASKTWIAGDNFAVVQAANTPSVYYDM
jgi:hypothetical protein